MLNISAEGKVSSNLVEKVVIEKTTNTTLKEFSEMRCSLKKRMKLCFIKEIRNIKSVATVDIRGLEKR